MSRKFSLLVVFCIVLFAAIVGGYWSMLDSAKLHAVRDQATPPVQEPAGARPEDAIAATGTPPATPGESPPAVPAAPSPAASPQPVETASAPSETGRPPDPQAADASANGPASDAVVLPSFDVLRVEPDGSAVLAGRAGPGSEVRLVDGARTIGTARATAEGNFAIVLDEPLPSGDHQIHIETSHPDGRKTISAETAIVSVPRPGEPGELLAMVEVPDKPSRLITLPRTDPAAAPITATPDGSKADGPAFAGPSGIDTASLPPPAPESTAKSVAGEPSAFAVEAVEIENGSIYIAGRAPGAGSVRVYVDDRLVGEDRKRANGRFLVTAKTPLAAGDHQIRADIVGSDGKVALRVEVPFAKPEGGTMSAIAANEAPAAAAGPQTDDPAASQPGAIRPGAEASAMMQPDEKLASAGGMPAMPAAPSSTAVVQQPSGSEGVLAAISNGGDSSDAEAGVTTVRQPALEGVNARVLIRRGDTLWRISRDNYGFGRRYTVIYLANGDQIRNPDRIYPGQVFRLPKNEAEAGATPVVQ